MAQKQVLIIEAEEEIRLLLERIFEAKQGYQVVAVSDSFRALDWLLQRSFDLILLDQQVIGISWLSLSQIIRSIWPNSRILLLAGGDALLVDTPKNSPVFDGFLAKPFTLSQLWGTVEPFLDEAENQELPVL